MAGRRCRLDQWRGDMDKRDDKWILDFRGILGRWNETAGRGGS